MLNKRGIIRLDLRRRISLTNFEEPELLAPLEAPMDALPDEGRRVMRPRIVTRRPGVLPGAHAHSRPAQRASRGSI